MDPEKEIKSKSKSVRPKNIVLDDIEGKTSYENTIDECLIAIVEVLTDIRDILDYFRWREQWK